MLSQKKVYNISELNFESNSLCYEFDQNNAQIKKTYLDKYPIINQYSTEYKINETDCLNSQTYQNGRWTNEENQRFIEALFIYGTDWKKVQYYIKTRTSIQSRSHAQKFFITFNKKYKQVYGKENIGLESTQPKADYILNILSKMQNCKFIASLCKNSSRLFEESNLTFLNDYLSQEDKDNKLGGLNPAQIKKTIEEKKEILIKVIDALMKVSSRTKNNSNIKNIPNTMKNVEHNPPIIGGNEETLGYNIMNHIEKNEVTYCPNLFETNGTAVDCNENPINILGSFEDPFRLISFDDYDCLDKHYIQDDILNLEMPYFFGQGK